MIEALQAFDTKVLLAINQAWRNPFFDLMMPVLSQSAVFWALIVAAYLGWAWFRTKNVRRLILAVLISIIAISAAETSSSICKTMTERQRPLNTLAGAYYYQHGWQQRPADFTPIVSKSMSFYSGHAVNFTTAATLAAGVFPPAAPIAAALVIGVGYSRLYLAKHYPLDVLTGMLAGLCIGWIFLQLYRVLIARLRW